MKDMIRKIGSTLVLGAAVFSTPLHAIVQAKTVKDDAKIVLKSGLPMGFQKFYDTNGDGTLDRMVEKGLLCVGPARGLVSREYSITQNPEKFVTAQSRYNQ